MKHNAEISFKELVILEKWSKNQIQIWTKS